MCEDIGCRQMARNRSRGPLLGRNGCPAHGRNCGCEFGILGVNRVFNRLC